MGAGADDLGAGAALGAGADLAAGVVLAAGVDFAAGVDLADDVVPEPAPAFATALATGFVTGTVLVAFFALEATFSVGSVVDSAAGTRTEADDALLAAALIGFGSVSVTTDFFGATGATFATSILAFGAKR